MAHEIVRTEQLLMRAHEGDRSALEALYARYLPRLCRWAAGRLPAGARDLADTHDLVQDTLLQTFKSLDRFHNRGEGAFIAYLRQAMLNRISNEVRRVRRNPAGSELVDEHAHPSPSPLEQVLGRDALDCYERSLHALTETDRTAIVARLELGCSYEEVAFILDKPTQSAARKTVERALRRLSALMGHGR